VTDLLNKLYKTVQCTTSMADQQALGGNWSGTLQQQPGDACHYEQHSTHGPLTYLAQSLGLPGQGINNDHQL